MTIEDSLEHQDCQLVKSVTDIIGDKVIITTGNLSELADYYAEILESLFPMFECLGPDFKGRVVRYDGISRYLRLKSDRRTKVTVVDKKKNDFYLINLIEIEVAAIGQFGFIEVILGFEDNGAYIFPVKIFNSEFPGGIMDVLSLNYEYKDKEFKECLDNFYKNLKR